MSSIIETGIDYKRLNDIKYMRSYLMRLNDDLKYMLTNLGEDNFDAAALESWQKFGESVINLSKTAKELELELTNTGGDLLNELTQKADSLELYITKGNATTTISLSTDVIRLSAERLKVVSDNFSLDENGLKLSGEIRSNAGSFGGFNIRSENGQPYFDGSANCSISGGTMEGGFGYFKSFSCAGSSATDMTEMGYDDADLYLRNCSISCRGMKMDGEIRISGDLYAAIYNPSEGSYGSRHQFFVQGGNINCDDNIYCEVYSGTSDSGTAQCYSFVVDDREYSDRRLKEDIAELEEETALSFIKELRPVRYVLKDDEDREHMLGLIAQEVAALEEKYGDMGLVSTDEESGMYSISYEHLIPIMAAAIQYTERRLNGSD